MPKYTYLVIIIKIVIWYFFLAAAAAAASAGLNSTNNGTFPNTGGASPYVISPQDQQQFLAAMAAGQVLPGKKGWKLRLKLI